MRRRHDPFLKKLYRAGTRDAITLFLTYYKVSRQEQRIEEQLLRSGRYGEVAEMEQTWLGRIKSKERREAWMESARRSLISVVTARFPDVSEEVIAQIERLRDTKLLDNLIHEAAVAPSLEEIERQLRA